MIIYSIIYNLRKGSIGEHQNDIITTFRSETSEPKLYNSYNKAEYSSGNAKVKGIIRPYWEFRLASHQEYYTAIAL